MLPYLCFTFDRLMPSCRKKKDERTTMRARSNGWDLKQAHSDRKGTTGFPLRSGRTGRTEEIQERKREMASKVSNISDLIHRVASSCLTHHPAGAGRATRGYSSHDDSTDDEEEADGDHIVERELDQQRQMRIWEEVEEVENNKVIIERVRDMEGLMAEVFESVTAVKRAYVCLQEAHSPWDPEKMRAADAAVVAELKRLARVRDRYRRRQVVLLGGSRTPAAPASAAAAVLSEAVAPYEAALDDLRREIKAREAEVENLKEKLRNSTTPRSAAKKRNVPYGKRVSCITGLAPPGAPTAELFEALMEQVKTASKSFTSQLLSMMRAARWDISAAIRSIIEGDGDGMTLTTTVPAVEASHAKHALESYVNRRLFQGFENETFYIEGSLTSLLHPAEFRRDCFNQFRDMRGMDPGELLGILPTCQFGRFCGKKYLAVVHPKMEESLFGGVEQRRQVVGGGHPRTGFYGEFLRLAKAVWLLHLLAFALDPAPSHFEATKGADFNPDYMESVVRFPGGRPPPPGSMVGFSVSPGFKLTGNDSVIRARVYLQLPRDS